MSTTIAAGPLAFRSMRYDDLRGADLRGLTVLHADLRGADLRDACLDDARLGYVNLDGADLRGASVRGATLRQVTLGSATLNGIVGEAAIFDGCRLDGVQAAGARLDHARFSGCSASGADLTGAGLRDVAFLRSHFEDCVLRDAELAGSWSSESVFARTDLTGAKDFGTNRALVVSLLRSALTGSSAELLWLGAVVADESRCWDEWQALLRDVPSEVVSWARSAFDRYPQSGCTESLFGSAPQRL